MPLLPAPLASPGDEDLARRRRRKAEKAELDAEAAPRRMPADERRWIETGRTAKEWGRALTKIIVETETFICSTLPNASA